MAVDSRQKRTSMIASGRRLPWFRRFTLPVPDSSVETPDRAQLASIYSGLIASSLPSPSTGGGGGMLMMGCGAGGGFSPLSLSPTVWALPSRSFSDNGVTPAVDNDPTYLVDDASENNNDPIQTVLANRPLYDANAFGSGQHGWYVDGSNDYFSLPITFPSVFSVSVWVKTGFAYNAAAQTYNILSFGGTGQFTLRYEGRAATLGVTDAFAVVLNSDSVDYPLASGSLSFASGAEYHLVVTCDYTNDEYAFYINGVEADTSTGAQTLPTGSNKKFGEFYSGGFGWLGHLGPLVITSDILTASEILALYNRGPQ